MGIPILNSSNLTLFQSYTLPFLHSSNPTLFQSYTLPILHSSNPTHFQSYILPILHFSNLTLFQSYTPELHRRVILTEYRRPKIFVHEKFPNTKDRRSLQMEIFRIQRTKYLPS